MKFLFNNAFKINIIFIMLGIIFLMWFYVIDGHFINKPLIFINGVDEMNFQVEKESYRVGEQPIILSSFCKNRPSSGTVEWTLIDSQRVFYPESEPAEIPVGCYPKKGGYVEIPLPAIPSYIRPSCDVYYTGIGRVTLRGGRVVEYRYQTEPFCVIQ